MRKKILLLAAMVVASSTTIDAQRKFPFFWKKKKAKTEQTTPAKKESEYDKLFKKKHETAKGLITLHLLDGKVYFELPVDLINKDMLIGSTVTSISDNGNAVVGSKPTDLLHVMFTRNKTHVQLRQVNTDYITGSTQIDEALRKSTLGAIISNQKIQAYNNDSTAIVFDMTGVFLSDNKKMSPFDRNSIYGMYNRTENYQSDCSYISQIKAFKDNVSIKSCLSYTFSVSNSQGASLIKDRPFTAEMTRSIMLLKEKPYRPRMADYRIGVFFTGREQLGGGGPQHPHPGLLLHIHGSLRVSVAAGGHRGPAGHHGLPGGPCPAGAGADGLPFGAGGRGLPPDLEPLVRGGQGPADVKNAGAGPFPLRRLSLFVSFVTLFDLFVSVLTRFFPGHSV